MSYLAANLFTCYLVLSVDGPQQEESTKQILKTKIPNMDYGPIPFSVMGQVHPCLFHRVPGKGDSRQSQHAFSGLLQECSSLAKPQGSGNQTIMSRREI